MSGGTVEWVRDRAAFAALRDEWNDLPRVLPAPFLRHEWFACWLDAFGGDVELETCVLRREGHLVGAVALGRTGRSLRSLANKHTQVFGHVGGADTVHALAAAVAEGAGDELELWGVPVDDPFLGALEEASRRAGRIAFRERLLTSPVVDTAAGLESYQRGLSSTTRRTISRYARKAERDLGARVRAVEAPTPPEPLLERCFALEAAGWKGRDGSAILSHPDTAAFFRALLLAFAAEGRLRATTLEADGKLLAFELGVLDGRRLWSLKTSYAEPYAAYSPGRLVRFATIERCFELGLEGNEMLGDADAYKLSLATRTRANCVFRSYRRALVPAARFVYRRRMRPALKRAYLDHGGLQARMAIQRALVRLRT